MLDSVPFPLQYLWELHKEQESVEHLQHAVNTLLEGNSAFLYTMCGVSGTTFPPNWLKNNHTFFLPFFFRIEATLL